MKNQIQGPLLKLKNAQFHIDKIEKEINTFFKTVKCNLVIEKEDKSTDRLVKVKLEQAIPEMLPLWVGDAIFNIRSSLDHLAVELSKARTGTYQKIYFPFRDSSEEFESLIHRNKLDYFSQEAIDLLKEIKPYKGGDNLLWSINKIRNVDTHNFILPIGSIGSLNLFQNAIISNAKVGIMITGPGRLDEGIVISNLGENGTMTFRNNSQPNIMVNGQMTFGDVEIINGKIVIDTLKEMKELVENILVSFSEKCF